jgi:hypothetical protein
MNVDLKYSLRVKGSLMPLTYASTWLFCFVMLADAALLRVEVSERSDVLGGKSFGTIGPYERVIGKAYFAVDPKLPANRIITDIDKAPRNEKGLVEFSADIYVLKPRDLANGNGAALFEVLNRGDKRMFHMFNGCDEGPAISHNDPRVETDFGDGFLLERGYTLVWLGWQFDVSQKGHPMRLYAPIVRGITGPVRSVFVVNRKEYRQSLGAAGHVPYPALNPEDPKLALTVRDRDDGPRSTIARSQWRIEEGTSIAMAAGFEPGKIYELVYTSQDPAVAGVGPAAIRDLISFLKYSGNADTMFRDYRRYVKRAYSFGRSQSGRFSRTFLYFGFNRDERNRRVFDGMLVLVAGAGRGSFNHRFAQPSRGGHPFIDPFYPADIFPFTDVAQTDPETGINDGLLSHATPPEVRPKIFYINSSYEYYGRAASLIHTTIDGKRDAPIPPTTRIYVFAGGQHWPAEFPPSRNRNRTQNLANPNPYGWSLRASLMAMDAWVKDGKEPPPSKYPRIADGSLVSLNAVRFPKITGVVFPTRIEKAYRVDYGPEFRTAGIVSIEPPIVGKAFPVLVPQVDDDGNEIAGIRMPCIQVPLATFTGWNLRAPEIGAPDELYNLFGSYLPFPRRSIEQRYSSREDYLIKVQAAARALARSGYLLERDVPQAERRGAEEWDYLVSSSQMH